MIERAINNIIKVLCNMLTQFDVDKIQITEDHINYYKNYFLKDIPHDKFTTKQEKK